MTQRPDVCADGGNLLRSQLRAAHRRHGTAIVLRLRNAIANDARDACIAAIAPEPVTAYERWAERRTIGVITMAARARGATFTALEHPVAELDHAPRGPGRNRKSGSRLTRVGMNTLRRMLGSTAW